MSLFSSVEKGLGLFQQSGVGSLLSPDVNKVVETAASLTRTAQAGLANPPVQGAPQGKPVVQANVTQQGPVQAGVSDFVTQNKGPLIIVGVVLLGVILFKKAL